jgi:hypothetical protein
LRKQWAIAIAATVSATLLYAASIAEYGVRNVVDYLSVLSFLSWHGESYFPNQSVNGVLNRLLGNGENLTFGAFPSFHPLVYSITIASSVAILGTAMFWKVNQKPGVIDMAIILISATIASPIAWEHHFGILLPVFAALLPIALHPRDGRKWTMASLWIAFALTSQTCDALTNRVADTSWNFIQSYRLLGGLIVLAVLYRVAADQSCNARINTSVCPAQ